MEVTTTKYTKISEINELIVNINQNDVFKDKDLTTNIAEFCQRLKEIFEGFIPMKRKYDGKRKIPKD